MDKLQAGSHCFLCCPSERILCKSWPESTNQSETKLLQENCQLFPYFFISCQIWGSNLWEFCKHENLSFFHSLSKKSKLHTFLLDILQITVKCLKTRSGFGILIVNGASLVKMVPSKTFEECDRKDILLPKVEHGSINFKKTDIIVDVYCQYNLNFKLYWQYTSKI